MWVYPTIQAINVGLSMSPSSSHPPRDKPPLRHICPYVSAHTCRTWLAVPQSSAQVLSPDATQERGTCSDFSSASSRNWEGKCCLELRSERNFDFMLLIIFLQTHSRIKRKDAEIVPLSQTPQWASLVKKTRPPPLLSFLTSLFTIQHYTTYLKKDRRSLEAV